MAFAVAPLTVAPLTVVGGRAGGLSGGGATGTGGGGGGGGGIVGRTGMSGTGTVIGGISTGGVVMHSVHLLNSSGTLLVIFPFLPILPSVRDLSFWSVTTSRGSAGTGGGRLFMVAVACASAEVVVVVDGIWSLPPAQKESSEFSSTFRSRESATGIHAVCC